MWAELLGAELFEVGEAGLDLAEVGAGPGDHGGQFDPGLVVEFGRLFRSGEFDGLLRVAKSPFAVGEDGEVAGAAAHPAGGPQLTDGLGPFSGAVGHQADGLPNHGDPAAASSRGAGVPPRGLRVVVGQGARSHEVPSDPGGAFLAQAAQVATGVGVQCVGRGPFGQVGPGFADVFGAPAGPGLGNPRRVGPLRPWLVGAVPPGLFPPVAVVAGTTVGPAVEPFGAVGGPMVGCPGGGSVRPAAVARTTARGAVAIRPQSGAEIAPEVGPGRATIVRSTAVGRGVAGRAPVGRPTVGRPIGGSVGGPIGGPVGGPVATVIGVAVIVRPPLRPVRSIGPRPVEPVAAVTLRPGEVPVAVPAARRILVPGAPVRPAFLGTPVVPRVPVPVGTLVVARIPVPVGTAVITITVRTPIVLPVPVTVGRAVPRRPVAVRTAVITLTPITVRTPIVRPIPVTVGRAVPRRPVAVRTAVITLTPITVRTPIVLPVPVTVGRAVPRRPVAVRTAVITLTPITVRTPIVLPIPVTVRRAIAPATGRVRVTVAAAARGVPGRLVRSILPGGTAVIAWAAVIPLVIVPWSVVRRRSAVVTWTSVVAIALRKAVTRTGMTSGVTARPVVRAAPMVGRSSPIRRAVP